MKEKIYFGGAIRGDTAFKGEMREIVLFIKGLGFPVLTEHVVEDDPVGALPERDAHAIEARDIAWLDTATHMIAEISGASTGTGREIEYARTKHERGKNKTEVLCLYRKDREWFASPMVRGMTRDRYPNVAVACYDNLDEAKMLVKEFLLASS